MNLWGKPKPAGNVPDDDPEWLDYGPLYDEDGPGDPVGAVAAVCTDVESRPIINVRHHHGRWRWRRTLREIGRECRRSQSRENNGSH